MVAYSFKPRFVVPIQAGLGLPLKHPIKAQVAAFMHVPDDQRPAPKRQTIRAVGRRRHARRGEILQLYCGLRTKRAFLIGRAKCTEVRDIVITFEEGRDVVAVGGIGMGRGKQQRYACYQGDGLDDFARRDGFESWAEMREFWKREHTPLPKVWIGLLIEWEPLR